MSKFQASTDFKGIEKYGGNRIDLALPIKYNKVME